MAALRKRVLQTGHEAGAPEIAVHARPSTMKSSSPISRIACSMAADIPALDRRFYGLIQSITCEIMFPTLSARRLAVL
ncbi:MAG TPA: hypothetical protein VGS10_01465 [Terracidiphilus sp.]|nr:hypothetical protein [Terracidiphilus sp.]